MGKFKKFLPSIIIINGNQRKSRIPTRKQRSSKVNRNTDGVWIGKPTTGVKKLCSLWYLNCLNIRICKIGSKQEIEKDKETSFDRLKFVEEISCAI